MMKRIALIPQPLLPNLGEGEPDLGARFGSQNGEPDLGARFGSQIWEPEWGARFGSQNFKLPLPDLGEGFRERVKTTVLNLDKV